MKKFVSYLLAALVAVGIPLGTCLTASAATVPDAPQKLTVLTQSVTDTGFTLVWNKPDSYANISDYAITVTGGGSSKVYSANDNNTTANNDIKQFYAQGLGDIKDDSGNLQKSAYKISMHTFVLSKLTKDTDYTVKVQAVGNDGSYSDAATVSQRTATPSAPIDITSAGYDAVGDGVLADDVAGTISTGTDDTAAIQKAIHDCTTGGTVLIPKGKIFVTAPLTLKSDMTLDVEGTLLAIPDASKYSNPYDTDTTQTGQKSAPLISTPTTGTYKNIRIVGGGTINGNGWKTNTAASIATVPSTAKIAGADTLSIDSGFDQFMAGKYDTSKKPVDLSLSAAASNHLADLQYNRFIAQGASNAYSTRSNLIVFYNVTGVYMGDGLTLSNPSYHGACFNYCTNVVANMLTISTYDCNNGDGIELINGTGLTVVNSVFNTGDDCVNFNAGVGKTAAKNPSTGDAWIFDNYFGRGHGAVAMGSNTAAWIENITAEDNVCNGTAIGLRGKSASGTGGGARNIIFRDTAMANITDSDGSAFLLTSGYALTPTAASGSEVVSDGPVFHDILIQNCTVNGTKKAAISFNGAPASAEEEATSHYDYNITMNNVAFGGSSATYRIPANLSYLKNCLFNNVVFYSFTNPWQVTPGVVDANGKAVAVPASTLQSITFMGTTTAPDPAIAPNWSAGSTLTASNVTDTTATLTWSSSASGATGYEILDSTGKVLATAGATDTSVNLTGLTAGTKYTLSVAAVNALGNANTSGTSVVFTTTGTAASGSNPKTSDTTIPVQLPIMLSVVMLAVLVGVRRMRKHA